MHKFSIAAAVVVVAVTWPAATPASAVATVSTFDLANVQRLDGGNTVEFEFTLKCEAASMPSGDVELDATVTQRQGNITRAAGGYVVGYTPEYCTDQPTNVRLVAHSDAALKKGRVLLDARFTMCGFDFDVGYVCHRQTIDEVVRLR